MLFVVSRKFSEEPFGKIEDELIKLSKETKHIALIWDMNAQTSILPDFIVPDQELFDILEMILWLQKICLVIYHLLKKISHEIDIVKKKTY